MEMMSLVGANYPLDVDGLVRFCSCYCLDVEIGSKLLSSSCFLCSLTWWKELLKLLLSFHCSRPRGFLQVDVGVE